MHPLAADLRTDLDPVRALAVAGEVAGAVAAFAADVERFTTDLDAPG